MDKANVIDFEALKKMHEVLDTKKIDDLNLAIQLLILRLREAKPLIA